MDTKMKPATPLPWHTTGYKVREVRGCDPLSSKDAAYIAHAANAYPRLVEALRDTLDKLIPALADATPDEMYCAKEYRALLRELGEG